MEIIHVAVNPFMVNNPLSFKRFKRIIRRLSINVQF